MVSSMTCFSNDNGFLPYPDNSIHTFQQRTLVARWVYNQSNASNSSYDLKWPHTVQTVRKPVLNVMALLAFLGDTVFPTDGLAPAMSSKLGMLPTRYGDVVSILVWSSDDSTPSQNLSTSIKLSLSHLPFTPGDKVALAVFELDDAHGSSYTEYEHLGKPEFPSSQQLVSMRNAAEIPLATGHPQTLTISSKMTAAVDLIMRTPAVNLIVLCPKPAKPPTKVAVTLHVVPTQGDGQVIVKWDAVQERCLKTYAVFHGSGGHPPKSRVNPNDTIFTLFQHTLLGRSAQTDDCYSVAAIDMWGQMGPKSDPVCVGEVTLV